MMDDPIFDPWCLGDEGSPTRRRRPSRWRSSAPASPRVPASPPVPTPISPAAILLTSAVLPRIEALRERLAASRHETKLDEVLDEGAPSLRFRIEPWRGPFEESADGPGSLLEIVADADGDGSVTARHWPDPFASSPAQEMSIAKEALTPAWVDAVMLDFLARVLSSG